jgi:hypothetical protein
MPEQPNTWAASLPKRPNPPTPIDGAALLFFRVCRPAVLGNGRSAGFAALPAQAGCGVVMIALSIELRKVYPQPDLLHQHVPSMRSAKSFRTAGNEKGVTGCIDSNAF